MRGSAFRRIKLEMYKARTGLLVRANNMRVRGAFDLAGNTPSLKKVVTFSVMAVFALSVISWAVTAPIKTVTESPSIRQVAVTARSFAPSASTQSVKVMDDPHAAVFQNMPHISELPAPLQTLPLPASVSIHTVVVDKSRRELLVLEETQDNYMVVTRYPVSLGSERGDKRTQGDNKTPEGLYRVTEIRDGKLPAKYGPRAYVLNYPNDLDQRQYKSGYGIWIHGSGMGDKTKPTEGCVQLNDFHVIELGEYVSEGSAVYIFPEGFELPIENGAVQKNVIRPETLYALKEWRETAMAGKEVIPTISAGRTGG